MVLSGKKGPASPRDLVLAEDGKHEEQTTAGIQEGSKSSCCYSCSRKDTAWMATSDSYVKAEITFYCNFSNFSHRPHPCH